MAEGPAHGAVALTTAIGQSRHELARGQVSEIQRARMLTAAVAVIAQEGARSVTVAQLIERAGVSRKTFYDAFGDREECFLAAFERAIADARLLAREAYARECCWREGIRAALWRLLVAIDEQPQLARVCVVETLAAGERVRERRMRLLSELACAVDGGREQRPGGAGDPPRLTAEAVVGGVLAVLHSRLAAGAREPYAELLGPLMSMIVMPYLGVRAARRELGRPARPRCCEPQPGALARHPLEGLQMRLTYRTMRVLAVIGQRPGVSNREVAEGSGIVDAGQISKLLGRLERLELVENFGGGAPRGAANAWRLTERGSQLESATRATLA